MTRRVVAVPSEVAVLAPFVDAGVFDASEVQLSAALARLADPLSAPMVVALALAARGPRLGHVCVEMADVAATVVGQRDDEEIDLPWPDADQWAGELEASAIVASPSTYGDEPFRPLVWDGQRLYLQRYWDYEVTVAADIVRRADAVAASLGSPEALNEVLNQTFGPGVQGTIDLQREAVRVALTNQISVIAGGPGTGKTRTIARLLAAAYALAEAKSEALVVALAAPTGKAASRMTDAVLGEAAVSGQSVMEVKAFTLHRLLGWMPGDRYRHDASNLLPHDLLVIDETSMVPLQLMARLLRALKPTARLVLVGDPYQLASVEAGSVLHDLVGPSAEPADLGWDGPLRGRVTALRQMHRYDEASSIAALADAVRRGDATATLEVLAGGHAEVRWIKPEDVSAMAALQVLLADAAADVVRAALADEAEAGLAAAQRVKVLCATRQGPLGLYAWSDRLEAEAFAQVGGARRTGRWFAGRPVMVTANDALSGLFNGDVGLVVQRGDGLEVAMQAGPDIRYLSPSRLDRAEAWWAMTIHKSQGSEFTHAVVSLPTRTSPILSRELLYTAVTRGRETLTLVASEASIRNAVTRSAARASGLADRLWSRRP